MPLTEAEVAAVEDGLAAFANTPIAPCRCADGSYGASRRKRWSVEANDEGERLALTKLVSEITNIVLGR